MAKKEITLVDSQKRELITLSDHSITPFEFSQIETFSRSNCKLCKSPFREESERKFEETLNYKALLHWLKDEKEMEISYHAVRNHILYHYNYKEKKEALIEYSNDVKPWVDIRRNRIPSLRETMAVLKRNMIMLDSVSEDLRMAERLRIVEMVNKISTTLLSYENKLNEQEKLLEPANVVINELQRIVTEEIKQISNQETKKMLVSILEKLRNSVGDMILESKK